ncbi:MAG: RidA family protein [Oscillospiraceae bacterium]|nr:RidA family protein [Oscillospiraceae bacterium]
MKVISTREAPAAIGPYSQAVSAKGLLFTSGQSGLIPETGVPAGDTIEVQADQCCRNIEAILKQSGLGFENVIKTTCFLADMSDFAVFNGIYAKYFVGKPARSCVAVKTLPMGLLCEIEAIAEQSCD